MLKRDSIWLGLAIGAALPVVAFLLLSGINLLLGLWGAEAWLSQKIIYLLSIFMNLLPIRIYFVNYKMDRTGRGVLLLTFILMVVYFAIIQPI